MTKIAAYKFKEREVVNYGHFDAKALTFKPYQSGEAPLLHEALDDITLAVEAGFADSRKWPQQFFADKSAFDEFLSNLEDYDDTFRITDRWWTALSHLTEYYDEESFITGPDVATVITDVCTENNMLNWN